MAIVVMIVGLLAGLTIRKRSISNTALRRTIWVAILGGVGFGLVSLAFAPTLIEHRIARNEQLAAERLTSLKDAMERAVMERAVKVYGVSHISDSRALKPHYFGPPFSDMHWKGFVKQDGYYFSIHAAEGVGYTISAVPVREHLDGSRRFCADGSGTIGCHVKWNGSSYACLPCSK